MLNKTVVCLEDQDIMALSFVHCILKGIKDSAISSVVYEPASVHTVLTGF